MSTSQIRGKSAISKHNDNTTKETKKATKPSIKGTENATATTATLSTFETSLSSSFSRGIQQTTEQTKTKIIPLSSAKTANTTPVIVSSTSSPATTTLLPQANLLKIEPFVPSIISRPQRTMRRSYSTLSNTTLKKLNNQHVNKNLLHKLEIQNNVKSLFSEGVVGNRSYGLPKVIKPPTIMRSRPVLRGAINRQRSKSTSSSNFNSNRPKTANVTIHATPLDGTPSATPYSALIIQQPNGICRIQRTAKEQEKLPDRINYDKRGLTAIPIFENETNIRLLSLQHNLINTFHIPKQTDEQDRKEAQNITARNEIIVREHAINGNSDRNAELNILGNQSHQYQQNFYKNKQRLPLALAKYKMEQVQPQTLGQLTLRSPAPPTKSPMTVGNYTLQRNKLLHKSINMNNGQINSHKGNLQHPAQLRFSMRKSKSFSNNLHSSFSAATIRSLQNYKTALLKRTRDLENLKSFDSSASTLTTDSTRSTLLTTDVDESLVKDANEGESPSASHSSLVIKNKQLIISYGNIFQNLVFLDLYDNQIERISNLDGLGSLTVLLLGKNRITDITGLHSLKSTLRVLDLHGNKLCSISNKINCLKELKSLNLAGNQIRQINHNDFMGLQNLKELNLKRNRLKRINGFQHLLALERLWLCHNDLHKVDDMSTIAKAHNLVEITIENNPLTLAGDCVSFLVSYLPKLQTLSQMPITEQVRKAAMTWRTNRELSEANSHICNSEVFNIIRREEIISNARTNWELLRSQQMVHESLKQQKAENEIQKLTDINKNNYEEFIKFPTIKGEQQAQFVRATSKETEERSSSASSLGPNINSLSSCYSSVDEDDNRSATKMNKPTNNMDKPLSSSSPPPPSSSSSAKESKEQMEDIINHTSSTDNNQRYQRQSPHTLSQCKNTSKKLKAVTPRIATDTASNYAPTLNLEFPMETNKVSANQQNQTVTSTTTSVSSSILPTQTVTTATASSSVTVVSPASVTLTKRCMTGSLMRSQTIVGTVTGANGVGVGFDGNGGGCTNGYMVKTNTVATANNIRNPSKLNPNATTQTAAINTLQQTQTMTTATTTITTTTGYSSTAGATANSNANNSLMASSMNGNDTSLTSNINKTLATGASNSITGIAAHTAATITTDPCSTTSTKLTAIEREREQGGDYLIEICGRYLNIYGQGALRFIDKQWNATKANDVHTLNFSYINFNNIASILGRIKVRFVHAENFVFRETNINCLGQLNALADLQGITSLNIDEEGNPITDKDSWRQYAIYRLSHWGLSMLNNIEVTAQEIENSHATFEGLSDLILRSLPDVMLQPLLARLRLDESCTASKLSPKQWLDKPENKSLRLVVGKEALQWKKPTSPDSHKLPTPRQIRHLLNQYYNGDTLYTNHTLFPSPALASPNVALTTRERGKIYFTLMMENTCNAVEKLHKLEQIWPIILQNIVRNTLLDYSHSDVYVRNLMAEIMK